MAKERLSKLQKFILSATYKKTILREELPEKINRFKFLPERDALYSDLYFSALYESDILLNFYNLKGKEEKYGYEGGSNKEKTALHRSLKTLYQRGYINPYWQWSIGVGEETGTFSFAGSSITTQELSHWSKAIITLTGKGTIKAKELLKL